MDAIGMEKNEPASIAMFEKAAKEGYPPAMYNLGSCFYHGRGTSQQRMLGKQWLREAVSAGHAGANYELHAIGKEESGMNDLGRQE
jgi:TPR repeat protein